MAISPKTARAPGQRGRAELRAEADARRRAAQEWRRLYGTARWKRLRLAQLAEHPLCVMCAAEGVVTAATVCDHVARHRGDVERFWSGPFQSLCAHHHNATKQADER